jgi:hypothetical protein
MTRQRPFEIPRQGWQRRSSSLSMRLRIPTALPYPTAEPHPREVLPPPPMHQVLFVFPRLDVARPYAPPICSSTRPAPGPPGPSLPRRAFPRHARARHPVSDLSGPLSAVTRGFADHCFRGILCPRSAHHFHHPLKGQIRFWESTVRVWEVHYVSSKYILAPTVQ